VPAFAQAGFSSIITAFLPQGYSSYNALELQLNHRFTSDLQVSTAGLSPYLNANSVNFNNPEAFFASNARVVQVVGNFTW
jgi:hypothetical protein